MYVDVPPDVTTVERRPISARTARQLFNNLRYVCNEITVNVTLMYD